MSIKEINMDGAEDNEGMIEGTEIKEGDIAKALSSDGRETWVNEKRNPIKIPICCRIPQRIVIVMRSVERLMASSNMDALEFGLFLTGKLSEDGLLIIGEEFYIPKQRVSGASIDFEEEPDAKFNGVIHRHPDGCKNFSGTDADHINKNFEFSLLYVCNDITLGIFNLEVNSVRIQLPLRIEVMYPVFDLNAEEIINKIQRKSMPSSSTDRFLPGFPGQDENISNFLRDPEEEDNDDDDEIMYKCKYCGEPQFIDSFPYDCDGCNRELTQNDVDVVNDLSVVTPDDIIRPSLSDEDEDSKIWRPGQE